MAKNIIIFLNSFWNNQNGMSGGDQIVIQVYHRLQKKFHKIFCFTNNDGKNVLNKETKDIRFIVSSQNWDKLNILINYFLRTIYAFKCLFIKNIQIVHASSDFLPDVLPSFFYKLFHQKTKWVVNIMHIYPDWKKRPGNKFLNFIAQFMQKVSFLLAKKSDVIITLNQQVKNDLILKGFNKNIIKIIPAGINYNYFNDLKINSKIEYFEATFLARLKPSKGIFDLIKIWQLVVKKKPTAKLAIIGGGGENSIIKNLKKTIKQNNLENNIRLLGYLNNDQTFSLIKKSSIFVFPSHEEGFGIAIAEAMACGTPVIAWDLKVYSIIFENKIIKIKKGDVTEMSKVIINLLSDKNKQKELSISAQNFIKKYSWDTVSQQYSKILT